MEVRGLLSPEFTAKVPHLHELLWHRLIPAKDVQQFEETIGGPAIPTLDEITQKLKQMSAQYRKSADKEGLEQVQQTYLLVCEV